MYWKSSLKISFFYGENKYLRMSPANIYLLKVNSRNTRKRCQWLLPNVFIIVNAKNGLIQLDLLTGSFNFNCCIHNFTKEDTLTRVFSCEFCQIFKSTFLRTPRVAGSILMINQLKFRNYKSLLNLETL